MTRFFTRSLGSTVLAVALLASCSRPVAYFQRGPVQPASRLDGQTVTMTKPVQPLGESSQAIAPSRTEVDPANAYVWQTDQLPVSKSLDNRVSQAGTRLLSTAETRRLTETTTPRKLTGMERLVLRKVNKQISRQLAPNQPQKPMIMKGKLILSIAVLIAGILLMTLSTGPLIFIGLVVTLFGALGTIVSLIGIDSY